MRWWPFGRRSPAWREAAIWSLDLETGGLDPERDAILSVGMVPIRGGAIRAGESFYSLVRPNRPVAEAGLAVHHILPQEVERAPPLGEVLPEIDRRIREGVLLVHHAGVDVAFLRTAYRKHRRPWPSVQVIDTVRLLRRLERRKQLYDPDPSPLPTVLPEARARLGLPAYTSHHALTDAVAAAELFLVLAHRLGARTVGELG